MSWSAPYHRAWKCSKSSPPPKLQGPRLPASSKPSKRMRSLVNFAIANSNSANPSPGRDWNHSCSKSSDPVGTQGLVPAWRNATPHVEVVRVSLIQSDHFPKYVVPLCIHRSTVFRVTIDIYIFFWHLMTTLILRIFLTRVRWLYRNWWNIVWMRNHNGRRERRRDREDPRSLGDWT